MKKAACASFLLLFIIPNAWAQVSIINDQKYVNEEGVFHLVGEIENNSSVPLNQIVVSATFYSSSGNIIGKATTDSILETILPDKKGPFDLSFYDYNIPNIDRYSLEVSYKPTNYKNESLEILNSETKQDTLDNLIISGKIINRDYRTANAVIVVATLYDKDGKVVATGSSHAQPDYLRSGAETPFAVLISDRTQTEKIQDYSLSVESEEYTAIPEFPLGSGIMLVASVFIYLIFAKKFENPISIHSHLKNST